MDVLDPTKTLMVKIFDEETVKAHDLVCQGSINLATLCTNGDMDEWFQL